jgi:hypothetical protein
MLVTRWPETSAAIRFFEEPKGPSKKSSGQRPRAIFHQEWTPSVESLRRQSAWADLAVSIGLPVPITSENRQYVRRAEGESRDSDMDLIKTRLIGSVFVGGGDMGVRMRPHDPPATVPGPLPGASLAACYRKADGPPMRVEPEKEMDA